MNSRRAWLVCGVAVLAYLVAVLQRTSLSVAGVDATERFDISAAQLSSLAVIQLIIYASLQIPVGVLVDRLGAKRLIVVGAALMAIGQLCLAIAPDLTVAFVGRVFVGAGDAMTFIPVTRLLAAWFSGKALPLLTQAMGTLGQLGQVLSAVPLAFALQHWGWLPSYSGVAAISILATLLVIAVVADSPSGSQPAGALSLRIALSQLKESIARPGTRLGFWVHFVSQSSGTMFALLWGFPFLSVALGYGPLTASALLTLMVVASIIVGPFLGILSTRFPHRRTSLVLGIMAIIGIFWGVVLLWPGQPPLIVVISLIVSTAVGGPASLIGFDFVRTHNPARSIGSASGLVNVAGFLASFIMMFGVGVALDLVDRSHGGTGTASELYSLDAFRIAFLVQFPVIGVGVARVLSARKKLAAT